MTRNTVDFLLAMAIGFALLLLLVNAAGCATARSTGPVYVITQTGPAPTSEYVVIRVRIVDTDPSDDVTLSFVYLCSRAAKLLRGERVQS